MTKFMIVGRHEKFYLNKENASNNSNNNNNNNKKL